MIDFHSHILPGIDDGSRNVEESIKMLRQEAEQGITHVVCTPHFYPRHDRPAAFLERRARAEDALRNEMAKYNDLPQLSVGAEVYYFRGISESDLIKQLTIQNKSCIMIEMIPSPWGTHVYDELLNIYRRWEIVPVFAHVDRYISQWRTFQIPEKLNELPVLVQANAEFFLSRRTQRLALRLLQENKIQLLGSDCHNLTDRAPNLGPALECIEAKLGREAVEKIRTTGRNILDLSETDEK